MISKTYGLLSGFNGFWSIFKRFGVFWPAFDNFFIYVSSFFQAIPEAVVSWKYKETEINNGSTLVNDIDMRQYYYGSRHVAKSVSKT